MISFQDMLINIQELLNYYEIVSMINALFDVAIKHANYTKIVVGVYLQKCPNLSDGFLVNGLSFLFILVEAQLHLLRQDRTLEHDRRIVLQEDGPNGKPDETDCDHGHRRPHLLFLVLLLLSLQLAPLCSQPHKFTKATVLQHTRTFLESRVEMAASVNPKAIIEKDPQWVWMTIHKFDHSQQTIIASIKRKLKGPPLPTFYDGYYQV